MGNKVQYIRPSTQKPVEMELFELDDLISGLGIDPIDNDLYKLYSVFKRDFEDQQLIINGLKVKVILTSSNVLGYESYPETFVHLITRKGNSGKRVFDRHRANKIHWIRCILENRNEDEITFFQYPEPDGILRDYFWYKDGDFLVIMEQITPDYLIVTSFHIDDNRNKAYFEKKEKWYRDNWT
jgi:hypothetical protein